AGPPNASLSALVATGSPFQPEIAGGAESVRSLFITPNMTVTVDDPATTLDGEGATLHAAGPISDGTVRALNHETADPTTIAGVLPDLRVANAIVSAATEVASIDALPDGPAATLTVAPGTPLVVHGDATFETLTAGDGATVDVDGVATGTVALDPTATIG